MTTVHRLPTPKLRPQALPPVTPDQMTWADPTPEDEADIIEAVKHLNSFLWEDVQSFIDVHGEVMLAALAEDIEHNAPASADVATEMAFIAANTWGLL